MSDSSHETSEPPSWSWEESLRTAILIGLSLSEYEEITPYEMSLFLEVYNEKTENEQDEKILLVWLGEYYHRVKKLPPLKQAIAELKAQPKKKMSDNEMLEMAKKLNTLFGGTVEKGEQHESEREES